MVSRLLACLLTLACTTASAVFAQSAATAPQSPAPSDQSSTTTTRVITLDEPGGGTLEKDGVVAPPTGVPRGYAVVIGIAAYPNLPADKQLHFADSDARAVYRALISAQAGAFPPENVHVLIGPDATLKNIRHEIEEWLPSVAGPADRVVVFFAGHGYVSKGAGYFAPVDVDLARLESTGYPMKTLGSVMASKVKARWKVLLTDACHSAKVNAETTSEGLDQQFGSLPTNFLTLTATTERESSHEDSALGGGYGFFTHFLERALQGEADQDPCDGRVTADELVEFVRGRVRDYAKTRPKPVFQTPTAHGDYDPQMLLAVASKCIPGTPDQKNLLYGNAVVETNLDDTDVFVDGRLVGKSSKVTPLKVPSLPVGQHEFKGVRQGYEPDVKTILIAPGQDVTVTLRIRYVRTYKKSTLDLGERGDRLLNTIRSTSNPVNILPLARKQSEPDLLRARDFYQRALAEDASYSVAAYHLGEVYQLLGQMDEALKAFSQAIEIDPTYIDSRTQHAAILIERGDTEQAIRELNDVLRLDSQNDDILAMLARAYFDRAAWSNAIEFADRAIAIDESNAMAHFWRADARRQLAASEEAPAERTRLYASAGEGYRRFLDLTNFESSPASRLAFHFIGHGIGGRSHANREESYNNLRQAGFSGLCLVEDKVGSRLRAREHCQRALSYDKKSPITYFLLGNVNRNLYNDYFTCTYILAAARNYNTMVELNPDLAESRNAKNYLEQITAILPKLGCKS